MTPATLQPHSLQPVTGKQGITIPELEGIGRLTPDAYAIAQVISGSLGRLADRLELLQAEAALEKIKAEEAAELRHHELLHALHQCSHFMLVGQSLVAANEGRRFPSEAASLRADGLASYAQATTEPIFDGAITEYAAQRIKGQAARDEEKARLVALIASTKGATQ
jgi:hypothetical protein